MAAKLEWIADELRHAGEGHVLGTLRTRAEGIEYDWVLGSETAYSFVSEPYENKADARQDCEREVRRLIKEAGVVLDG